MIDLEILKSLASVIKDKSDLRVAYNAATSQSATSEELSEALHPTKQTKPRKVKTEETISILPAYCETVGDMKRVKAGTMTIEDCIAKHVEIIKNFKA